MSGFSVDWLNQREHADHRARDSELLNLAKSWLRCRQSGGEHQTVVDLGAGTGSTFRAFSQDEDGQALTRWHLVDQDTALLGEATRRHGHTSRFNTFAQDLSDIENLPLHEADLVTASALLDLVGEHFIDQLVNTLVQKPKPIALYAALNYDGKTNWFPAHPLDKPVLLAFNCDQQRDKGFGPALGPQASNYLEQSFKGLNYDVFVAESAWSLSASDSALVIDLINGISDAVSSNPELNAAQLKNWTDYRLANAKNGTCFVGHTDFLALPKE